MAQPTYEESEAAAAALLKKYNEGTLTLDDTEMDDMENIGEIGSIEEARAGDPAKDATKQEGDDASKKQSQLPDDGAGGEGEGTAEDGSKVQGDQGDDPEAGKGTGGDGDGPGKDPGDDEQLTEGLDTNSAKRVTDAQRKMHEATGKAARLEGELNQVLNRVAALEAGATPAQAPKLSPAVEVEKMSTEELATLADDYPGLAKIVNVVGGLQDQLAHANEKLAALDGDVKTTRATTSKNEWMSDIRKEHPDVDDIQGSDPFTGWLQEQPDYIRQAVYESGTVRDMVTIIQNYKDDIGLKAPSEEDTAKAAADEKKKSKLEQAREIDAPTPRKQARQHRPEGGTTATMTQSEIKAFNAIAHTKTPEEIAAFETRVDKAMAAGLVSPN